MAKTCRHFGIARQTFHDWMARYEKFGEEGLINHKPCPKNPCLRVAPEIQEKIIYLRTTYHLGSDPICWFIQRYYPQMKISGFDMKSCCARQTLGLVEKVPKFGCGGSCPPQVDVTHRYYPTYTYVSGHNPIYMGSRPDTTT